MISHEKFNILCWVWIGSAVILFPILLKVTQPYGKHTQKNWGPMLNNKLGWFLMELPALTVFLYFLSYASNFSNIIILSATILWSAHYIHRSLIFPLQIHTKGKKMPVAIVLFAIIFNSVNGFLNGYWLSHFSSKPIDSYATITHITIGVLLFIMGQAINKYHDRLLINLRKTSDSGYKIPFGGLFKYISCPNFFGEIITWLGFFILTLSLPALSFLVWTMANLLTRALDHHKWYKSQFADYPVERKAIFPYLL